MGDLNFDLSRSKIFTAMTYGCAIAGAAAGISMPAATSALGLLGAGAAGAVAGGIGIPVALTGLAVLGYVGYVGIKSTLSALKKEGAVAPLGMAIIGLSAAKALFVTPFTAARALGGKIFPGKNKSDNGTPAAAAIETPGEKPSRFFTSARLRPLFAAAVRPFRGKRASPAPRPKHTPRPPIPPGP